MAVGEYITGGTGASLLGLFDMNLGDLIGTLFGSEDDFVGAYERTWTKSNSWGIGRYNDVRCEDLRLWFTIASPGEPLPLTETRSEMSQLGEFPMRDSFNLDHSYESKDFPVQGNQNISIILRAGCPIYATGKVSLDGLLVMIGRTDPPGAIYESDVRWIKSYELHQNGNRWEANINFRPDESGLYELSVINMSDEPSWCEYTIALT